MLQWNPRSLKTITAVDEVLPYSTEIAVAYLESQTSVTELTRILYPITQFAEPFFYSHTPYLPAMITMLAKNLFML